MTPPPLVGRTPEKRLVIDLIGTVRDRGQSLVIRGEAGIGKSSLLAFGEAQAKEHGVAVFSTSGVASEAQFPFAALHRLLNPILEGTTELPAPQRDALKAAFGISHKVAPNLFLIALAALNMLGNAATKAPLLLVVDDAQWLDRSTSDVLAFIARRLESEPILLLIAVREKTECPLLDLGLPELYLEGLNDPDARALLDTRTPDLAPAVREQLLLYALGNPLALVELPLTLTAQHLGDSGSSGVQLPLTRRLEEAFATRVAALPKAARTLLLVAAVNDTGHLEEIMSAATLLEALDLGVESLAPAETAGLVEIDGVKLRFRHPLVRSAIQQMVGVSARHAAHAALARVLDDQTVRRAWHRAASVGRPDEEVAAELDVAADQARQLGAISSAVAGLERAAMLTPDPLRRSMRLLRAAELAFELGQRELVTRLLPMAELPNLAPVYRGRMALVQAMVDTGDAQTDVLRIHTLIDLADQVSAQGEVELALTLLRVAALRCWWVDQTDEVREQIVAAANRMPVNDGHPQLLVILAVVDPIRQGKVVLERLTLAISGPDTDPHTLRLLAQAAYVVGDMERAADLFQEVVFGLRLQGRLGLLASALALRAWAAVHLGDWRTALPAAEEAGRLALETNPYGRCRPGSPRRRWPGYAASRPWLTSLPTKPNAPRCLPASTPYWQPYSTRAA